MSNSDNYEEWCEQLDVLPIAQQIEMLTESVADARFALMQADELLRRVLPAAQQGLLSLGDCENVVSVAENVFPIIEANRLAPL